MHDDKTCEAQMRAIIDAVQPLLAATDPKRYPPASTKELADAREGAAAVLAKIVEFPR